MMGNDATRQLYAERAACVAALVSAAESNGWTCYSWIDPKEGTSWPVVCIELPTGQVTWHIHLTEFDKLGLDRLPRSDSHWDGHTTGEKYDRLAKCDWIKT